jgi:hypothetical protein
MNFQTRKSLFFHILKVRFHPKNALICLLEGNWLQQNSVDGQRFVSFRFLPVPCACNFIRTMV